MDLLLNDKEMTHCMSHYLCTNQPNDRYIVTNYWQTFKNLWFVTDHDAHWLRILFEDRISSGRNYFIHLQFEHVHRNQATLLRFVLFNETVVTEKCTYQAEKSEACLLLFYYLKFTIFETVHTSVLFINLQNKCNFECIDMEKFLTYGNELI